MLPTPGPALNSQRGPTATGTRCSRKHMKLWVQCTVDTRYSGFQWNNSTGEEGSAGDVRGGRVEGRGGVASTSTDGQLKVEKPRQPLDVLREDFDVVMTGSFDPERVDGPWTSLVDHLTMGEVDHFVIHSVNDEHNGCYFGHFVDAANTTSSQS